MDKKLNFAREWILVGAVLLLPNVLEKFSIKTPDYYIYFEMIACIGVVISILRKVKKSLNANKN